MMTFPQMVVVSLRPALTMLFSLGLTQMVVSLCLPQMTDGTRGQGTFFCAGNVPLARMAREPMMTTKP